MTMKQSAPPKLIEDEPEVQAAFSERAKEYADRMLHILANIAENSDSDSARVAAANAILDRAEGKPPQALNTTLTQINSDDIGWAGDPSDAS